MKINCLFHEDHTASLHLYETEYHCFGCGAHGYVKDLPTYQAYDRSVYTYKTDIDRELDGITKLPQKLVRGLLLPYDINGYYIVYPNAPYYIRRSWDDNHPNRYYSPKGHNKPIMQLRYGSYASNTKGPLLVIEGQINALSAQSALGYSGPIRVIACPGSAADFNKPNLLTFCLPFDSVCIIVDNDQAGKRAALKLSTNLIDKGKDIGIYPMSTDLNEILIKDGHEAVREEIKKALELPSLRGNQEGLSAFTEGAK